MDHAMPREVFMRTGKNATDESRRSLVDVAVGADETGRNRAYPADDSRHARIEAAALRLHCVYIVCDSDMERPLQQHFDLSAAKAAALEVALEWGLEVGPPFTLSNVSYVAPAGDAVLKVAWEGDAESMHEGDALELWDGDGAVRLLRRSGRALLEERACQGTTFHRCPTMRGPQSPSTSLHGCGAG
jgi:hypothetical protein